MQTLAFRADWRPIHFALLAFREAFLDALQRHVNHPTEGHLESLSPDLAATPQSFLSYLEAGGPGNILITAQFSVSDYIYSGEATRTPDSSMFLDLFRDIGQLVGLVLKAVRNEQDVSSLVGATNALRSRLSGRSALADSAIAALLELFQSPELRVLLTNLTSAAPASREAQETQQRLQAIERDGIEQVRRATKHLQDLYLAGTR